MDKKTLDYLATVKASLSDIGEDPADTPPEPTVPDPDNPTPDDDDKKFEETLDAIKKSLESLKEMLESLKEMIEKNGNEAEEIAARMADVAKAIRSPEYKASSIIGRRIQSIPADPMASSDKQSWNALKWGPEKVARIIANPDLAK